jgi:hypothetical protein
MASYWSDLERDGHDKSWWRVLWRFEKKKMHVTYKTRGRRFDEKEVKAVLRGQWETMVPKFRSRRDRERDGHVDGICDIAEDEKA